MNFWTAIFLGIVQGLTEFLPVSSSGHLAIFENLFQLNYNEDENLLFEVLLHLATLVAVFLVYRKEIIPMVRDSWNAIFGKANKGKTEDGRITISVRSSIMVVLGTLPLLVILPFYSKLTSLFQNTSFVGFALLVTGGLLFLADKLPEGKKTERNISAKDVLLIGAAQAVATLPGVSRSGSTMVAGMARGLKRDFAVRFSFLLSIPAVLGSVFLELVQAFMSGVQWKYVPLYLVGMIAAGTIGYFCIGFVRKLAAKAKLSYFSYYCWGVGALTLILSMFL